MYEEEEDEDYLNDIISLNYAHIKTEIIDLATSSDDEPEDDKSKIGISWYGNRSFVLPITFFDVSTNVEYLKKCRPLSVNVVDCDKHPSYYEKLLRPKKTVDCQILTEHIKKENDGPEKLDKSTFVEDEYYQTSVHTENKSTFVENKYCETRIPTEHKEVKTKVLHSAPGPLCSKNKNYQRRAQSPKSHKLISNAQHEKQKSPKSKTPTQVHLKNKDLVRLDSEYMTKIAHSYSTDKKTIKDKAHKKEHAKGVGEAMRNKLETIITGLLEMTNKDSSQKRRHKKDNRNETKEGSKKNHVSQINEQNSEGSPTRCSIKMTSSKVFDKVKNTHNKKAKEKAPEGKITSISEEKTTEQTVPKLSLKRKNSELSEFYVINSTKENPKAKDSPNKKSKISNETRERLISKLKATNDTQCNSTSPASKISSSPRVSTIQSPLTGSPPSRRSENYRKSDIVKHSTGASNDSRKIKPNDFRKDTMSIQNENKLESTISSTKSIKNQIQSNSPLQRSDANPDKSKTHIMSLNTAHSDTTFSANKSMVLSGHLGQDNFAAQKKTSNENIHCNQYLIIQKTPPEFLKNTINKLIKKVQETSKDCQVQSNVSVQKPIELAVSSAQSNSSNTMQTGPTTSVNKGLQFPLLKQSGLKADTINRIEPYASHPESRINPEPSNLYLTHKDVTNPNITNGNTNSPANLRIPTNIIIRHPKNICHQMSNQLLVAKDSDMVYMKKPHLLSYKEVADGMKRPQENGMQPMSQTTQPNPVTPVSSGSNLTGSIYFNATPVNKAMILKGSSARVQPNNPNIHPNYGNPIPTVINHNVYQPRMSVVKPVRFLSPWPPPNTNVAHVVPQGSMENNTPHCRMPFVNTNFPRQPAYTEYWQQPMYGDYGHYFMYPPRPPPPPQPLPAMPEQRSPAHNLPAAPPAPTGAVIGSDAEGQLIKRITIAAVPVVHEKEKMLAELNNAVEELETTSDMLEEKTNKKTEVKRLDVVSKVKSDSSKLCPLELKKQDVVPIVKSNMTKPCPLSKKKNINNNPQNKQGNKEEEKSKSVLGKVAKGYSPPILPIPSYQQALEILTKNEQKMADVLKKIETINTKEKVIIENDNKSARNKVDKGPSSKPLKLPDSMATKRKLPATEKKKEEKPKKISIEDYKRKLSNNNVTVRECSKSKCKRRKKQIGLPVDKDLGYDSDATLVL